MGLLGSKEEDPNHHEEEDMSTDFIWSQIKQCLKDKKALRIITSKSSTSLK